MKQCKYCDRISADDVFTCPACGAWDFKQLKKDGPDTSGATGDGDGTHYEYREARQTGRTANVSSSVPAGKPIDKWIAFILCFFLGGLGAHKFYEGRWGWGIVYIFTGGLFGIGWFVDLIKIACKPNPYYIIK